MEHRRNGLALAMCAGLAISATAKAQVAIVNNIAGTFTDISGSGMLVVTGDDASGPVAVSAAAANAIFAAGTVNACTNGHVGYGGPDIQFGNTTLPAAFAYTYPAAAVYWDDLITHVSGAGVYTQEVVENGVPTLIIEWVRMDHFVSSTDSVTFELKIYGGGTPTMGAGPGGAFAQYVYSHMLFGDPALDNGASATIGFQYSASAAEPYAYNTVGSVMDGTALSVIHATTGACCLPDLSCAQLSQNNCASQGGAYRGDNSPCATANCPQPGACCLADGTCVQANASNCGTQGGVYHGNNSLCANFNCNVTGACCMATGCTVVTQLACLQAGGLYTCDNGTCANTTCPTNLIANGGFETGAFAPEWTQFGNLGFTAVNTGAFVGVSPHSGTYEAHFGPITTTGGIQQTIAASAGAMLTIDFWYACNASTPNSFSADLGTTNLVAFSNDLTHPGWTHFAFTVPTPTANPVLTFTTRHDPAYIFLDDIRAYPPVNCGPTCYANCDGSTGASFLNVNDFVCFQSKFAAGDSYANCDGSTGIPLLTINDYVCFQTRFAAGCSAP